MTTFDFYVLLIFLAGAALLFRGIRNERRRLEALIRDASPGCCRMLSPRFSDRLLALTGGALIASAALILAAEYAEEWLALFFILCIAFLLERGWYERRR